MKIDQHGERAALLWKVDPDGDLSRWSRNQPVFDVGDRFWFSGKGHRFLLFTSLGWCHTSRQGKIQRGHLL
jgi:hypothetical protein